VPFGVKIDTPAMQRGNHIAYRLVAFDSSDDFSAAGIMENGKKCYKVIINYPTAPELRRYTTL